MSSAVVGARGNESGGGVYNQSLQLRVIGYACSSMTALSRLQASKILLSHFNLEVNLYVAPRLDQAITSFSCINML